MLDFRTATEVGRRVPAEEDTVSEVSEAELRGWEEELDAGEDFTPDFMASAGEGQRRERAKDVKEGMGRESGCSSSRAPSSSASCLLPLDLADVGDEKADEWANIVAEEPDTHGVEWLSYSDRTEVWAMPLPRSLANLKREISEKKWAKERQGACGRTSKQSTLCQRARNPMERWRVAPRGSLGGSTRSRQGTVNPDSTSIGRRTFPPAKLVK